jgi:hypothetical protein
MSGTENKTDSSRRAGAFDIRNFIALLIGIYGVVLVIAGLIGPTDAQLVKSDGLNVNLWAGLGMVVVAAVFLLWARLRPVVVPDEDGEAGRPDGQ